MAFRRVMEDVQRFARILGQIIVRAVQVFLAILLLFSFWAFGDLPSGPDAPEQAGTLGWALIFAAGFATLFLVVIVVGHFLFKAYRAWSSEQDQRHWWSVGRLAVEIVLGVAIVAVLPPLDLSGVGLLLLAPAALAWAVLIHYTIETLQLSRAKLTSE